MCLSIFLYSTPCAVVNKFPDPFTLSLEYDRLEDTPMPIFCIVADQSSSVCKEIFDNNCYTIVDVFFPSCVLFHWWRNTTINAIATSTHKRPPENLKFKDQCKFLFLFVPKCAGMSLKQPLEICTFRLLIYLSTVPVSTQLLLWSVIVDHFDANNCKFSTTLVVKVWPAFLLLHCHQIS